jgi:Ca2+-binding RTX toxin-like protein
LAKQHITIDIVHGTARGAEVGTDFFESIEVFVTGTGDDKFIAAGHGVLSHRVVVDEADVPENTGSISVTLNTADESASHDVQESLVSDSQTFHGGEGFDTLSYENSTDSITINVIQGTASGTEIGTDHFDGIDLFVGGQGDDVFIVGQMSTSLNGGCGNDMFEFVLSTDSTSTTTSNQHISGFEVGDWVRIAQYDVFENGDTSDENNFQNIMDFIQNQNMSSGDNSVDAVIPIHIRHEQVNGSSLTYIESDIDQDGKAEFSIVIDGAHHLNVIDHQHV